MFVRGQNDGGNSGPKVYSAVVTTTDGTGKVSNGTCTASGKTGDIDLGFTPALVVFQFTNANGTNKSFCMYNTFYGTSNTTRITASTTTKENIPNPQTNEATGYVGIWSVSGNAVKLYVQSGMTNVYLYAIENA